MKEGGRGKRTELSCLCHNLTKYRDFFMEILQLMEIRGHLWRVGSIRVVQSDFVNANA